jgi:transglutaminase-like putative cysteine protease
MYFEISHFTEYHYAEPATLSPQILRLRAREDGTQRLHDFRLDVEPSPSRVSVQVEPDGNTSLLASFSQPLSNLRVHAYSTVETHRTNPFDFVITSLSAMHLPALYDARLATVLAPSLSASDGPAVKALAEKLAGDAGYDTLQFLTLLNRHIVENMRVTLRLYGDPMAPDECLSLGEGACRDLAMVFIAACRHMGIAARFVSGYQMTDPNEEEHHMHAWAEVYLPGGGWRGFDPTHGIAVDDRFVAVAASPIPALASPIEGWYTPNTIPSRMKIDLDVRSSCPIPSNTEAGKPSAHPRHEGSASTGSAVS